MEVTTLNHNDVTETNTAQAVESRHLCSYPKSSDFSNNKLEVSKIGKRQQSRRRKSASKPRRIRQVEPDLARSVPNQTDEKGKSLDSVLERVLKARQAEDQLRNKSDTDNMIDMHETLAIHHHHSPKAVRASATSPGSVDSTGSLYSNERNEDNLSDSGHVIEPFVKIRPRSHGNTSPVAPPSFDVSGSLQRSMSSDATQQRRPSVSPPQVASPKEGQDIMTSSIPQLIPTHHVYSSSSPPQPAGYLPTSSAYEAMNGNHANAIVAMAAGIGLPTMIPTSAIMTSNMPVLSSISEPRYHPEGGNYAEGKSNGIGNNPAPQANTNYGTSARGIIGSNAAAGRTVTSPSPEDRAQYKRPPHTYPALIASAILDSPGHLITLRGIYDYIMNHFPYYKYCHDKSAWQNSIRHNLSLNQCFVKVPRYENAAKSNYWTMTREGFEEFGNENSFKRRRRRGAALAPISAYKAKKYQNEASKGKNKNDSRHQAPATNANPPQTEEGYAMAFPTQLMGLAAGAWNPGFHVDEATGKGRKRSQSPSGKDGIKHPRMMVLKQGDGPTLGDEPKRPNSLSSVEEMQGTLNSFSKTLLDSSMLTKANRRNEVLAPHLLTTSSQPWIAAAQKNLMASSGMLMPSLIAADRSSTSPGKPALALGDEAYAGSEVPVTMEGIEIGSEVTIRYDNSEVPIRHFRCRFCTYTYVGISGVVLEQHSRMIHQLEITNAKAKAVAAAAVAKTQSERMENEKSKETTERLMSLQNMVSGLSPRSMMAAAQSNLLAAAQATVGNSASAFPYSGTFSSGLLDESVMRSLAEQVNASQASQVNGDESGMPNMDAYAYQRQQALNSAFQQAAAASTTSTSQDQFRLFYQQLAMHNPFLANSANSALAAASFPRPMSAAETDQSSQLKQHLWQQYQQKLLFNQMKALSDENARTSPSRPTSHNGDASNTQTSSSPCRSPASNTDVDAESKKSIHGWKQCARCDFTAKGDHGLELHLRKAHAQSGAITSSSANGVGDVTIGTRGSPNLDMSISGNEQSQTDKISSSACETKFEECDSPLTASAFPTPPLSNSPSYVKRHFTPLDLSGAKDDDEVRKSPGVMMTSSTQTSSYQSKDDSAESRTCHHCNIVFGDEMMHALHMSCHDKTDPFKCTICGQSCHEKYYFNVHLLRGLHQTNNNNSNNNPKIEQPADDVTDSKPYCRRHSNSSDASSVASSRGRISSDNSDVATYQ